MPEQRQPPALSSSYVDPQGMWSFDSFLGATNLRKSYTPRDTQHDGPPFAQADTGLPRNPSHSLGYPVALRKSGLYVEYSPFSHDRHYCARDLALDAPEAARHDKLLSNNYTDANRRHFSPMERGPESMTLLRKRHDRPVGRSANADNSALAVKGLAHSTIQSPNSAYPDASASDLWHQVQNDPRMSLLTYPVIYRRAEVSDHSRHHLSFRANGPFFSNTELDNTAIATVDDQHPPPTHSFARISDSGDEPSDFHDYSDDSEQRPSPIDTTADSNPPKLQALDPCSGSSHMPEVHSSSPSSLHLQFAHHLNVAPRSRNKGRTAGVPTPTLNVRSGQQRKKKKSKMHECDICHKLFPRPSGLTTHQNSHFGKKPFPCSFPQCTRFFAVRSNAKRHLRTHGIIPMQTQVAPVPYTVGFSPPLVQSVEHAHPPTKLPLKLKWVALNASSAATYTTDSRSTLPPEDEGIMDVPDSQHTLGELQAALLEIVIPGPPNPIMTSHASRLPKGKRSDGIVMSTATD